MVQPSQTLRLFIVWGAGSTYHTAKLNDLSLILALAVVEIVCRNNIAKEVYSFDLRNISVGVYFVSVHTAEGVKTQRFVK